MIVDAVQPQPACKIDQCFLLGERPEHGDRRLKRRQLTVGIENVELPVVLSEGRSGFGIGDSVAILVFAENQILDDLPQGCTVVREILFDADAAAFERHDRQ